MPLFTVIIATHNRSTLLRATIDSVLAQSMLMNWELIVVDDGSTDDTLNVLRGYKGKLRVIQQSNAGPGVARNAGIAAARGRYICFLDDDDVWLPWTLETYQRVVEEKHDPASMVAAACEFRDSAELKTLKSDGTKIEEFADFYAASRLTMWHGASAIIARADALRSIGGYAAAHVNAEDTDLMMRLGTERGFVRINQPITVGYHRHSGSAVANLDRTFGGMKQLISQEKSGKYPGGSRRRRERQRILTRHLRPATLMLLAAGQNRSAWKLYRRSFWWNLSQGRVKFLLGFFLRALQR